MPIGKGGQSGSQSGTQNSQYSGTGTSTGETTGTGTSSTSVTGADDYTKLWNQITGMNGTTGQQGRAADYFSGALTGGTPGLTLPKEYFDQRINSDSYTLDSLARKYGGAYAAPTPLTAPTVGAAQSADPTKVNAGTAASFMAPYQQGYTNDVVDATTADLLKGYGKAQNASNMAGTAAGGFQNSRMGLRDAQTTDDFLRTLATTTGTLRDAGFGRAVSAGAGDAGVNLSGQQANQGAALSTEALNAQLRQDAAKFNAQNGIDIGKFNNTMLNNRQQFDVGAAYQGDAGRDAAATSSAGVTGQQSAISGGNATSLASIGGQTFQQILAALAAGTPLFGSNTTGSTTGTTSGTTTGSGTSSGNTTGNSSSKGGGVSIGG